MAGQWMPADAWIRRQEARYGDGELRLARSVEEWLGRPVQEVPRVGRCGRPILDRAAAEEAADLARSIGVRPAARELGTTHATLLSAWRRFGITVCGPNRRRWA